jgi:hypothetical protein
VQKKKKPHFWFSSKVKIACPTWPPPKKKVPWKVQPINFLGKLNLPPLFTKYKNGTNIRVKKVGPRLDLNIILNLMGVFKMRKFQ